MNEPNESLFKYELAAQYGMNVNTFMGRVRQNEDLVSYLEEMGVNIHKKEPLLFTKSIPAKVKKISYCFHNFLL